MADAKTQYGAMLDWTRCTGIPLQVALRIVESAEYRNVWWSITEYVETLLPLR